jgi:hypothetical protein
MDKINKKQYKSSFQKIKNIFQSTPLLTPAHDGPTEQADGPTRRPGCSVFSHPPSLYPLLTDSWGHVKLTLPGLDQAEAGGYTTGITGDEVSGDENGTYVTAETWRIYRWTQMGGLRLVVCAATAMAAQRRMTSRCGGWLAASAQLRFG